MTVAAERVFPVAGARLAARHWGSGADRRVLALHGWLDNASSFDALAPRLPGVELVAPDLPGHGCSDHRPPQATYNLWDDLPALLELLEQLGWEQFDLIGHSRGAMVALLLAATFPERVRSAVFLDALLPEPVPAEQVVHQLRRFLEDHRRLAQGRRHPGYASLDDAVAARCRATGMAKATARALLPRNLEQRAGRYYWRTDARLAGASALKLDASHNRALLSALAMPALLLLATEGLAVRADWERRLSDVPLLRCARLPGGHHFHLEQAESVAAAIVDFWGIPAKSEAGGVSSPGSITEGRQ